MQGHGQHGSSAEACATKGPRAGSDCHRVQQAFSVPTTHFSNLLCVPCCVVQLLLLVCEIALQRLSHRRLTPAQLLPMLSLHEEHLQPLLASVLFDSASNLQLLNVSARILTATFGLLSALKDAVAFAAQLKQSGLVHMLLLHCGRLVDSSMEAELMHRDGVAPRAVLPALVELLAIIVARCAHKLHESDQPQQVEAAITEHVRQCESTHTSATDLTSAARNPRSLRTVVIAFVCSDEWNRMCNAALDAVASGSLGSAEIHLSLLAHWQESHCASDRFEDFPAELDSRSLTAMLDNIIARHHAQLNKSMLQRICRLLMVKNAKATEIREKGATLFTCTLHSLASSLVLYWFSCARRSVM